MLFGADFSVVSVGANATAGRLTASRFGCWRANSRSPTPGQCLMDARGPQEARLRAVERAYESIDRDLRNINRRIIALSQSTWAAWSDVQSVAGIRRLRRRPPFSPRSAPRSRTRCRSSTRFTAAVLNVRRRLEVDRLHHCSVPAGGSCGAGRKLGDLLLPPGRQYHQQLGDHRSYNSTGTPNFCPVNGSTCSSPINRSDFFHVQSGAWNCCAPNAFFYPHGSNASPAWANADVTLTITPFVGNLTTSSTIPFTFAGTHCSGSGTLTWNSTTAWTACVAGISFSGGGCATVTMAITFSLDLFGNLTMKWLITNATSCPAASVRHRAGQLFRTGTCRYSSDSCPSSVTYQLQSPFGGSPEFKLGTPTVTLTL